MSMSTVPSKMFGRDVHISSIIVYFNTNANGDDFDIDIQRDNHAGGTNNEISVDNIGNGGSGNDSLELISGDDFDMHDDRVYQIKIDANNTDAAGDVRIYDIKFQGYLV